MDAFATVSDLESRWRILDASEKARAAVLLQDAAALILSAMEPCVEVDEEDETQAANLVRVSCAMVMRAMGQGDGEQEHAWGGNIVTSSCGDLYLSKQDKRSLGIGGARIGVLPMV